MDYYAVHLRHTRKSYILIRHTQRLLCDTVEEIGFMTLSLPTCRGGISSAAATMIGKRFHQREAWAHAEICPKMITMQTFLLADDFQEKQRRILNEWQFDGIIPCHGDVLKTGGKGALKAQLGLT